MRTVSTLTLLCLLSAAAACGGGNANTKDTDDDGNLRAYGHLLGESRVTVDAQVRVRGEADAEGWVPYQGGLQVQFTGENATKLTQPVPEDLNCTEAAIWAGFKTARAPILRDHRCIWPDDDVVHALAPDAAGVLDLNARVLTVRVAK